MEDRIIRTRKIRPEVIEERKKSRGFNEYILKKYKVKGKRAIRFSEGLDELDILLGIKKALKFDDEDKKYLTESQLKELEKIYKLETL